MAMSGLLKVCPVLEADHSGKAFFPEVILNGPKKGFC